MQKSSPENTGSLSAYTKGLLAKYDFPPKKKLGQNFIIDKASVDRIIAAGDLSNEDTVIEIGTGLGTLTKELAKHAARVISVEYDKILFEIDKELLKDLGNVELIRDDFLMIDLSALAKKLKSYKVIGNLPYYITAPIMTKLIEARPRFTVAVLTTQKEVAERLTAKPGSKQYGTLSIFVQYGLLVEIDSLIPNSAFYPHPAVSSAVVVLKPRVKPIVEVNSEELFFNVVHAAFAYRRKTLRNSILLSKKIDIDKDGLDRVLNSIGMDGDRRGETLSMDEFAKLSNALG